MRVLFIGNSHTYFNDMPKTFREIAVGNGIETEVTMLSHGGMGFDYHAEQPDVPFNILYGNYDFIVLQHVAHPFGDEEVMFRAAHKLNDWIRQTSSKAVLYMTWPEKRNPQGLARMADAYLRLGRELPATVAPVGLAWRRYGEAHTPDALYFTDGEHASPLGSRLAAYTIFAAITRREPRPLQAEDAPLIQCAWAETSPLLA